MEVLMYKRSRSLSHNILEPIALRFIDLAIELDKGKLAKEALYQYKNIFQNTAVQTIHTVMAHFITSAQSRIDSELEKRSGEVLLKNIEDLEAAESPRSILELALTDATGKDRSDKVTSWLSFLWEAYRTTLDILRNNPRLEALYHSVSIQAFKFCRKYNRKSELRKLCEIQRQHLTNVVKYSNQQNSVNLSDPETLQRYLEVRLHQLNGTYELELWQEAFKSIEDIHQLMLLAPRLPQAMMANYYDKLSRVLLVGDNMMFHSAALIKYYGLLKANNKLNEEDDIRYASSLSSMRC